MSFGFNTRRRNPTAANNASISRIQPDQIYTHPCGFKGSTTISTASDVTYTAGEVVKGIIVREVNGASRSDTLPTAAQIVSTIEGCVTGMSFVFVLHNVADSQYTLTLVAGSGITFSADMPTSVDRDDTHEYIIEITDARVASAAITMYTNHCADRVAESGAVTQGTSVTTGVTLDSARGIITTFTQTLAVGATNTFVVTNNYASADSTIIASVSSYAGTGIPIVFVTNTTDGSFNILLTNVGSAILNAPVIINFMVTPRFVAWSSFRPLEWTAATAAEANAWRGSAWSPELAIFAAVSNDGTNRVMTSPDGIAWTSRLVLTNAWNDVIWSPDLLMFLAVSSTTASPTQFLTSTDGITWTPQTAPASLDWRTSAWSPELGIFVAVAFDSVANNIGTSPDGINWTSQTKSLTTGLRSVIWVSELSLFVVVGINATSLSFSSPDGINWTSHALPSTNQFIGIAWSPQLQLMVSVSTNGTNRVISSSDGKTWTARTAAEQNQWLGVVWADKLGMFVAIADKGGSPDTYFNRTMYSRNGIDWAPAASIPEVCSWKSISWSPELQRLVVVGIDGTSRVRYTLPW